MANYIVFETTAIQYGIAQGLTLKWFAAMFIISDFFTIPIPYILSRRIMARFPKLQSWLEARVRPRIANIENSTGGWGEIIGFSVISYFTSTWLASTIAALMLADLRHAFIGIVAGDLAYFATLYGTIAGTDALLPGSKWKFLIVMILVILVVTIVQKIVKLWVNALTKNKNGPLA